MRRPLKAARAATRGPRGGALLRATTAVGHLSPQPQRAWPAPADGGRDQTAAAISSETFQSRAASAVSLASARGFATLQSAKYSPVTVASVGCVAT